MKRVLVVDDELAKGDESLAFSRKYAVDGFEYAFAEDKDSAFRELKSGREIGLILLDIVFDNIEHGGDFQRIRDASTEIWPAKEGSLSGNEYGLPMLQDFRALFPEIPVIMLSSKSVPSILLWCWKNGASYYLIKPPLESVVKRSIQVFSRYFQREILIGDSEAMRLLKEQIRLISASGGSISVLITGESGTGKELVARSIHQSGPRSRGPFVVVNCAAIPESLIESELFGHRKGAFTGANNDRQGRIRDAEGGVLFLDEIGELSLELQSKMLRIIDRGMRFSPVGASEEFTADVQVVAATNKELGNEVRAGNFREDLFYRLNVFPVKVPPLRSRKTDVPILSEHFLALFKNTKYQFKREVAGFSREVLVAFDKFDWPGNVRELENAIEFALVRSTGNIIETEHLPESIASQDPAPTTVNVDLSKPFDLKKHLAKNQWQIIRQAYELEASDGKRGMMDRIARRLGIPNAADIQRTLLPRIKKSCPELAAEIQEILPPRSRR